MIYEFGQELGLAPLIWSAENEDPTHPGHPTDPNVVMYWEVDSTALVGLLGGGASPNQFDASELSNLNTVWACPIFQENTLAVMLSQFWMDSPHLASNYWRFWRRQRNGEFRQGGIPSSHDFTREGLGVRWTSWRSEPTRPELEVRSTYRTAS